MPENMYYTRQCIQTCWRGRCMHSIALFWKQPVLHWSQSWHEDSCTSRRSGRLGSGHAAFSASNDLACLLLMFQWLPTGICPTYHGAGRKFAQLVGVCCCASALISALRAFWEQLLIPDASASIRCADCISAHGSVQWVCGHGGRTEALCCQFLLG